jgi:hypothetical protein
VLWCSVLQCSGLASIEFVSDVMARGCGSMVLCVCVCRGCFVYQVDSEWVGLSSWFFTFHCDKQFSNCK